MFGDKADKSRKRIGRMLRKLAERHGEACKGEIDSGSLNQALQSYLGILSHVDGHGRCTLLKNGFCLLSA
jgi:hypothetical protein